LKEAAASGGGTETDKFKLMQTGVQNVLFFKTTLRNPVNFALGILNDIRTSGEQRTRFLLRLIPIEQTCKAYEDNVKEAMQKIALKHFKEKTAKSYAILFKSRCNQDFSKETAIKIIGNVIKDINPNAKVEYKTPDLVIMVEVMKSNCCLSILPDYYGYKKYNLIELATAPQIQKKSSDEDQNVKKDNIIQTDNVIQNVVFFFSFFFYSPYI
jgi:tRNA acetyltransferase TAN1